MVSGNELVSKRLQCGDLLLLWRQCGGQPERLEKHTLAEICSRYTVNLHVDGFVEVLVLLDESLHTVEGVALVVGGQESFSRCHPVLSLLTVTVKQLQGTQQESVIQEYGYGF